MTVNRAPANAKAIRSGFGEIAQAVQDSRP
jgi:hypothetical protein